MQKESLKNRTTNKDKIMIKEIIQSVTDEPIEFIKNLSFLIGLTSTSLMYSSKDILLI